MTPYYSRNGITIYNADCLEVMPQLDGPFDAIIADLPYGTTACDFDKRIKRAGLKVVIKALETLKINPMLIDIFKALATELYTLPLSPLDLWPNYKRLIKDNGAVVLFGSEPFSSVLRVSNLEWFKYEWVWDKKQATGHLNAKLMPLKRAETILVFSCNGPIYNPQMQKRSEIRTDKPRRVIYGENRTQPYGTYKATGGIYTHFCPDTILEFQNANQAEKVHPTQKPLSLLQYLIRTYTNPGEIILDNAAGSGTTGVAAQNEGRRCVMIEQDEEYCKVMVDRLRQPTFFSIPEDSEPVVEPVQAELFNQAQKR